ncbi:MAG: DUF1349 domain-containing protein [Acidimicrobiales bacterium]|jgi:regulation of enolase protein 1 (concanavalin A-like superfamily)
MQRIDTIPPLPATFRWRGEPVEASFDRETLAITAGAATDWFVDPGSMAATLNAPALVCSLSGDFALSARVEVALLSTFDAGSLVLWHNEATWAKLAFELSPQGQPTVVSVVTRGTSDDCNSMAVGSPVVWLRVARLGSAHAFHASLDGEFWQLIRYFRLNEAGEAEVGFEVQSPMGEGCTALFSHFGHAAAALADLRSGV